MRRGPARAGGAALLLVLWLVALLTALIGAFALSARVEALQGRVLVDGAGAQEIARAGVEYALARLADPDPRSRWRADGRGYRWRYADAELRIAIVDESGKVDLNRADAALLGRLILAVGGEPGSADRIAAAIVDWRDTDALSQPAGGGEDPDYAAAGLPYGAKDAPFETVAEVEQVLGMTPALFARLAPYLTLYSGVARPDPRFAQGPVLTALGLDAAAATAQRQQQAVTGLDPGGGSGTYSIESDARLGNGRVSVLRTVVNTGGGPTPGSVYTALRWEEAWAPR